MFVSINSRGQEVPASTNSKEFVSQFYKIFSKNNLGSITKDSTFIYALNFKIETYVKNRGHAEAVSVVANDSLAYKLYPNYRALLKLNYISIFSGEKHITMIVPILIYKTSSKNVKYSDANGMTLLNMQAAINASYFLYSAGKYDNIQDAKEHLPYLANKSINDKSQVFQKVVLATPIICDLTITQ